MDHMDSMQICADSETVMKIPRVSNKTIMKFPTFRNDFLMKIPRVTNETVMKFPAVRNDFLMKIPRVRDDSLG
jgi:hypothetical protein